MPRPKKEESTDWSRTCTSCRYYDLLEMWCEETYTDIAPDDAVRNTCDAWRSKYTDSQEG